MDAHGNDDEGLVHLPPTAERVVRRALALALVTFRGVVEIDAADPAAGELWREARAWFHGLGIEDELEPEERRVVEAPLGSLPMETTIDITWRAEALVMLAWALGAVELPGLLEKSDGATVANTIGFLDERRATVLAAPRLRPIEELELMTEAFLAVHWRLRRHSRESGPYDFAALVAKNDWASLIAGRLELIDGDLGLAGVPLTRAVGDLLDNARSVIQERHVALEWLTGQHPVYSQVESNT